MNIGLMEVEFRLLHSFSLKDKRRIVKSIIEKSRHMFNVSAAEIAKNDMKNYAVLGFACISNSSKIIESTLDKILHFCESSFDIEITSARKEFL